MKRILNINQKTFRYLIALLLVSFFFAGCQSYKKVPYLQDTMVSNQIDSTSLYDARILPKDLLTIVVSCPEEPELAEPFNLTVATPVSGTGNRSITQQPSLQQYIVDNDGNVDFPILGSLHLGGLTKSDAERMIKDQLKPQFRKNPIVTVRMINYKVSVIGEVANPGTFTITNEKVNLLEALAMAGDLTIYGLRDNVKLIREDHEGKRQIITLDLTDRNILQSPHYYLQQNDIVYVTPNKTKARTADINTSTTIWFSVIGSLLSVANLIIVLIR